MKKHEVEIGGEFGDYKCVAEFKETRLFGKVWNYTIYKYVKFLGIGFWVKEKYTWDCANYMSVAELNLYCTEYINKEIIKPYQYEQSQLNLK